jgi:BirA family transcriptional regulator, biotin operon repressor / biotin---[acetyl-CoA-carboxylase] ligase
MSSYLAVYERLKDHLHTSFIGKRVMSYKCVKSTQDVAISLAEREKENVHGLVVIAESQKQGRGRHGKEWISPYGGIWLSIVILHPKIQANCISLLPLVTALVVRDTIDERTGLNAKLKWPNDVVINEKKVSGILLDAATEQERILYAIIGIGLNANVDITKDKNISNFDSIEMTSLKNQLSGRSIDRMKFTQLLLEKLEMEYLEFERVDPDVTVTKLKKRLDTLGNWVVVNHLDEVFSGLAIDIDRMGCLVVKHHDNLIKRVSSENASIRKASLHIEK